MILTLSTLFLVLIGVVCILIYLKTDGEGWLFGGVATVIIAGLVLLGCVIQFSLLKEMEASNDIVKIEAIRETFELARSNKNIHALELAAIQHKVAEKNEWIANAKFWATHPFTNWFWSKKILEIKPIR